MKRERVVFYADKKDKELLAQITKKTGVPASELLRRALQIALKDKR